MLDQIRRAEAYAAAEMVWNPKKPKIEALSDVDEEGDVSQLMVVETPQIKDGELAVSDAEEVSKITLTQVPLDSGSTIAPISAPTDNITTEPLLAQPIEAPPPPPPQQQQPQPVFPFRDPTWEATERSYQTLAITDLNNLTRSYNLMAPDLAKKPYFSLDRELRACFADVAPQLANSIKERATAPKVRVEIIGHRPGSVLERFGGEKAKVWDERKPKYGFREFWRDLWG